MHVDSAESLREILGVPTQVCVRNLPVWWQMNLNCLFVGISKITSDYLNHFQFLR